MERQYVAIDLHLHRSLIVRENEAGEELGVTRIDNDPMALGLALAEAGPDPQVAIEATYGWYWAVDVLQEQGAQVHLVNPSGLAWGGPSDQERLPGLLRSDRADAAAQAPRGMDRPARHPGAARDRRYRAKLVALRTGLKAQVKAVLAKHGLHPPVNDIWGLTGTAYLNDLKLDDGYHINVESLRDLVEHYDREVTTLERVIHQRLANHPGYRAIQAIEGVGRVLGAIFVAEIGDVTRFPNAAACARGPGSRPATGNRTPR